MIFRLLDHLRKKSESVRRQIVAVVTVIIMFIIVSVWVSTLSERLSGIVDGTMEKESISPFSIFAEQGKVFYESATDSAAAAREILNGEALPAAAIFSPQDISSTTEGQRAIIPGASDTEAQSVGEHPAQNMSGTTTGIAP
ncbi:MAG: hypothetical protein AAB805_00940 [Patescibacteria group bacterium]